MTCLLAIAVAFPAYAVAKDNDIDQGRFDTDTDAEDNVKNEAFLRQDPNEGSALSSSSCQLVIVAEVSMAALASASALAVINDEDEVSITQFPEDILQEEEALDAETAESACEAPVGPVSIDITTASGWGAASPHGTLGDLAGALSGGYKGGKGGPDNTVDQGRFETNTDMKENVGNEWDVEQGDGDDTDNSALAASNCQTVIAARVMIVSASLGSAKGTIEDSDKVVVTTADSPRAANFDFEEHTPFEHLNFTAENDHFAKSSCVQTVESITILVRPESSTIPPRS